MRNINCNVLSNDDTVTRNGIQIDANQLVSASFQIVFGDTTAAGTFKLQVSNDVCSPLNSQTFTVSNWVDLPSATATITSGGSAVISVPQMAYRWIRAVWVKSVAGNTTVDVNMNALSM